jgi:hypothetical protein
MSIGKGKGGIRKGQVATDCAAAKIDRDLKEIRDELSQDPDLISAVVSMLKKLNKTTTTTPCAPDGGAWFHNGRLIAVFEAKKQQDRGNAIERWYKNHYVCRKLNERLSYCTWARGEGAYPEGAIGKALDAAHNGQWNIYRPGHNSCWLSKDGFSKDEIKQQMKYIILERIRSENNEGEQS